MSGGNFPNSKNKKKTTLKNILYFENWNFLTTSLKSCYILGGISKAWKTNKKTWSEDISCLFLHNITKLYSTMMNIGWSCDINRISLIFKCNSKLLEASTLKSSKETGWSQIDAFRVLYFYCTHFPAIFSFNKIFIYKFFNTILKLAGAYILLLKEARSK